MNTDIDLICREQAKEFVDNNFADAIILLRDIVDSGGNLLCHLISKSSTKTGKISLKNRDIAILGVLNKQAIMLVDTIEILLRENAVIPACMQARALLEIKFYIEWILKDKEQVSKRINHYIVYTLRKQKKELSNSDKDEQKTIDFIEKILLSPDSEYKSVNENFENNPRKDGRDKDWYNILDSECTSIRQLVIKKLKQEEEYRKFYTFFSKVVHSNTSILDHISFDGKNGSLLPIRVPNKNIDFSLLIDGTVSFITQIFMILIKHYSSESEEKEFLMKIEEWQKKAKLIPKLNIS